MTDALLDESASAYEVNVAEGRIAHGVRPVMAALTLGILALFVLPSTAWSQRNAGFVGVVPTPLFMTPGQTATVSVTMMNTGSVVWVPGTTRLGSQYPDNNLYWGTAGRVDLAHHVYPGQSYTFTFQVSAPQSPDIYPWQWRMLEENVEWFGHVTTVTWVDVATVPPPGEGSVEAGADLSAPSGSHSTQTGSTGLTWKAFCNAWGTAPGHQGQGWLPVRVILRLNGLVLRDITYQVHAGLPYSYGVQAEVASSEVGRTVHCENRVNGHVSYYSQRYMPGNGPQFTEVRIKTFIPDEWLLVPTGAVVLGQEYNRPAILEGDDRGFDYHSQSYRTRMWGWLNNPAFDSQVLRAPTPPHPGLSVAYDYLTSLDQNGRITAYARADTIWGPPEKVSWASADMSRVGCSEFSHLGVQGNRAGVRIRCFHEANLPLIGESPDIDWVYNIDFWFGDDNLFVTIWDSCIDYFPSHELYVSGTPVILSSAAYFPLGLITVCQQPVSRTNQRIFQ